MGLTDQKIVALNLENHAITRAPSRKFLATPLSVCLTHGDWYCDCESLGRRKGTAWCRDAGALSTGNLSRNYTENRTRSSAVANRSCASTHYTWSTATVNCCTVVFLKLCTVTTGRNACCTVQGRTVVCVLNTVLPLASVDTGNDFELSWTWVVCVLSLCPVTRTHSPILYNGPVFLSNVSLSRVGSGPSSTCNTRLFRPSSLPKVPNQICCTVHRWAQHTDHVTWRHLY